MSEEQPQRARRQALAAALARPALIPAGRSVGRNYAGNPYPYRASSHFLYFVGRPIEGAFLLVEPQASRVFVPMPDADDALWHGETPTHDALSAIVGCEVRPLSELGVALEALADVASVRAPDTASQQEQQRLLGRALGQANDEALQDAIVTLRLVHDDAALTELDQAAGATVKAHVAGMAATRPGVTEHQVCAAMEYALALEGCGTAYGSIVPVHGEVLHNHHHGNACQEGDLLLADVGAETPGGWAGDVTRTWPVGGKFSATQRDIYDVVLAAQRDAIDSVRPGVRYRDVHLRAARTLTQGLVDLGILKGETDALVERGVHALFFPHGVGHLLGLDVHDMEDLGDRAGYAGGRTRSAQFGLSYLRLDRDLVSGMAVTIEPGFYQVPAILDDPARCAFAEDALDRERLAVFSDVRGIRIEDDVVVTPDEPRVLTAAAPKEAELVEAMVGMAEA